MTDLTLADKYDQLAYVIEGDFWIAATTDRAGITMSELGKGWQPGDDNADSSRGVVLTDHWVYTDRRVKNHNNVFISWFDEDGETVFHRQLQGDSADAAFINENLERACLGGDVRYRPVKAEAQPDISKPANDNELKSKFVDAQTLLGMEFEPIKYVIPGYVAEGLTILGGRPKLGKSWLALDFTIAVASGGKSLGAECAQGDSLYLALEDNQRRLQDRLRIVLPKMKSMRPDLSRLSLLTEAPKIGEGLIETLDAWRTRVDDPRLIVIDTLAMVRPPKGRNQDSYAADYAALSPLQRYASEHRIAVMVVTHVRKMEASDPLEMISGTNGLTGAADSIMVLDRTADGPKLYGRGRDVEEVEKALKFDGGRWSVLGNVDDVKRSDERRKILHALGDYGSKLSPKEIAEATGMKVNNVNHLLRKMVKAGEVAKDGYGTYSVHPGQSGPTDPSLSTQYLDQSGNSDSDSDHLDRSDRGTLSEAA